MEKLHKLDVKEKCTRWNTNIKAEIPKLKWSGRSVRSSESAKEDL